MDAEAEGEGDLATNIALDAEAAGVVEDGRIAAPTSWAMMTPSPARIVTPPISMSARATRRRPSRGMLK